MVSCYFIYLPACFRMRLSKKYFRRAILVQVYVSEVHNELSKTSPVECQFYGRWKNKFLQNPMEKINFWVLQLIENYIKSSGDIYTCMCVCVTYIHMYVYICIYTYTCVTFICYVYIIYIFIMCVLCQSQGHGYHWCSCFLFTKRSLILLQL